MKKNICFLFCLLILLFTSCKKDETLYTKVYDSNTCVSQGYSTGDFDEYENYNIGCYRTYGRSGRTFTTILATPNYLGTELPSAVYNLNEIKGIKKIEISYSSLANFYLFYSNDKSYSSRIDVSLGSDNTVTLDLENVACFFKICATDSDVVLNYVTIYYNNKTKPSSTSEMSYNASRINVSDFYSNYDNLSEGETRKIPSDIVINSDNSYTVTKYKSYTYHTLDYLSSHASEASSLALTDPTDVANYYMLFHTWPLNYFEKNDLNTGSLYFGTNALRRVSKYTRTDGYATSVPYINASGTNYPVYYELDFDASGYYTTNNRGVGRLVVWEDGFSSKNYDSNPVIVYTCDHYATFREYLNNGSYGTNFNAENHVTGYSFSAAKVLKYQTN